MHTNDRANINLRRKMCFILDMIVFICYFLPNLNLCKEGVGGFFSLSKSDFTKEIYPGKECVGGYATFCNTTLKHKEALK